MGAEVREVPLPTLRYYESLQIDSMAESFVLHEQWLKTRRDRYTPELRTKSTLRCARPFVPALSG